MAVYVGCDSQISEAQRTPFPIHRMLPIDHLFAYDPLGRHALAISGSSRKVAFLGIFAHGAMGGEARCQLRHAFPHPLDPSGGDTVLVSCVKLWDHISFKPLVERSSFGSVPSRIITVFPTIAQCPSHFGCVGFRPPAVQL